MDILFLTDRLKRDLSEQERLVRTYGPQRAKKLSQRLAQLQAADTLDDMRHLPGRCHELGENRAGQLALDLDGPYRLIFEPANESLPRRPDGGLDWLQVTAIRIIEVVDYHD